MRLSFDRVHVEEIKKPEISGTIRKKIRKGLNLLTKYVRHSRDTLQRQNTEISNQIFPENEYRGLSPYFHIHASIYPHDRPAYSAGGNM
jgi:hypothetical protein